MKVYRHIEFLSLCENREELRLIVEVSLKLPRNERTAEFQLLNTAFKFIGGGFGV